MGKEKVEKITPTAMAARAIAMISAGSTIGFAKVALPRPAHEIEVVHVNRPFRPLALEVRIKEPTLAPVITIAPAPSRSVNTDLAAPPAISKNDRQPSPPFSPPRPLPVRAERSRRQSKPRQIHAGYMRPSFH